MRRPPPGRERRWAETAEEARSVPRRCRIGKVCAECFPLPQRVRHRGGAPGRLHGSAGNPSTQSNRSPGWGRLPPQQQLQPHSRRGTAVIGRASLRSPGFAAGWNAPGSETAPRGDSSCYVLRPSPNCMTYKFSISCMRYKILGGWSVVRMSAIDIAVTGVGATTPLGADVPSTWQELLAGASGVRDVGRDHLEGSGLPVTVASPMALDPALSLGRVEAKRLDRVQQAAVVAAAEAWADAGSPEVEGDRLAVVAGSGVGA